MTDIRTNGRIARAAMTIAAAALVGGMAVPASAMLRDEEKKASSEESPKARKYCVAQVTTGTMLKRAKVCKTREQWIEETGIDPAAEARK